MTGVERGCLVIADIGGYTKYLSGVELEHSQDILADLMGTLVKALTATFQLAKLEGDCVFSAGDVDDVELRTAVESTYHAFRSRRRAIAKGSTTTASTTGGSRSPGSMRTGWGRTRASTRRSWPRSWG